MEQPKSFGDVGTLREHPKRRNMWQIFSNLTGSFLPYPANTFDGPADENQAGGHRRHGNDRIEDNVGSSSSMRQMRACNSNRFS